MVVTAPITTLTPPRPILPPLLHTIFRLLQVTLAAKREFERDLDSWTGAKDDFKSYDPPPFDRSEDDPPQHSERYNDNTAFTGPRSFFELFFDDSIINRIVTNTNANIASRKASGIDTKATDATAADIRALFGTLLLMSRAKMDRMEDYWHELYHWPRVEKLWARDRFMSIFRAMSVNAEPPPPDSTDRFAAVRTFVDELNKRFASALGPGRSLCIDETMIAFRGEHESIQFMPKKPISIGFKCFTITNSFGYVLCQVLYDGTNENDDTKNEGLTERVVLELVAPYSGDDITGPWHIVTMDSFYTGVPLFKKLHEIGTLAVGTVRSSRKFLPTDITDKKNKLKP